MILNPFVATTQTAPRRPWFRPGGQCRIRPAEPGSKRHQQHPHSPACTARASTTGRDITHHTKTGYLPVPHSAHECSVCREGCQPWTSSTGDSQRVRPPPAETLSCAHAFLLPHLPRQSEVACRTVSARVVLWLLPKQLADNLMVSTWWLLGKIEPWLVCSAAALTKRVAAVAAVQLSQTTRRQAKVATHCHTVYEWV